VVTWSAEQVLSLAPDAGSAAAGRKLAGPVPWSEQGATETAVWGLCQGSGKQPYQTVVDLGGPAYKCSCPSRKFPCKHALGLLLLWAGGGVPAAPAPPDWAGSWLTARQEKAATPPRAVSTKPPDPAAAAKRTERRATRVADGVAELDTWLADQVRNGLAGLERAGYAPFEKVAARMVDAQAPALAAKVRALPGTIAGGEGWPGRLLEELALLRLTAVAHGRIAELPEGLAACVRREVGYPVAKEDVLASPPVRDRWEVLALRDVEEERFVTRRVWLRGTETGRPALVLSFSGTGASLDATLVPGTLVDADLHFYPGGAPLRALVGERRGLPQPLPRPAGGGLADARAAYAAAVAADPWLTSWPVVVDGLTPVPGEPWTAVDAVRRAVPLLPYADLWRLLAVSGGHPVVVAGEYTPAGLRALSVYDSDGRLVTL
jgi:hypothetical protein